MSVREYLSGLRGALLGKSPARPARPRRRHIAAKSSVSLSGSFGWNRLGDSGGLVNERGNRELANLYSKHELVFACVREIAGALAAAPLEVVYDTPKGVEVATDHEALMAFYEHPDYGYADQIQLTATRLHLCGAAFAMLAPFKELDMTGEFTPLPTAPVKVIAAGPSIVGYTIDRPNRKPLPVKANEICPVMFRDPARYVGYVSPLAAASVPYETDAERQKLTFEILRNRPVVSAFLGAKDAASGKLVNATTRDKLQTQINSGYSGETDGRGRVAVLPPGLEFMKGVEQSDIDFGALASMSETRICMVFQVPPIIIGAKSGLDRSTFANYGEARTSFYAETIVPLWSMLASAFTRSILFGTKFSYRFSVREIKELQKDEDKIAKRSYLLYKGGIIKKNEAREMMGLDPDEEAGEEYYVAPAPPGLPAPAPNGENEDDGKTDDYGTAFEAKAVPAIGAFPHAVDLEQSLKAVFAKQEGWIKARIDMDQTSFDLSLWNDRFKDAIRPALSKVYEQYARRTLRNLKEKCGRREALKTKAGEIQTSFELVREDLLDTLEKQLDQFVDTVNLTTQKSLNGKIAEVVRVARETNTIPNLTAAVEAVFVDAKKWRARRIAITESSRAVHDSRVLAGAKTGVVQGYTINVSADACSICQYYDAKGQPTGVPVYGFIDMSTAQANVGNYGSNFPPFHPNCLLPGSEILASDIQSAVTAIYDGPCVEIVTRSGRKLTVTANDMLLTDRGFVRASLLRKGDKVVDYRWFSWGDAVAAIPDDNGEPIAIDEIVTSLAEAAGMSRVSRMPVAPEDFHGDAAFIESNIDVVRANGLLLRNDKPIGAKPLREQDFHRADLGWLKFLGRRNLRPVLRALSLATHRVMGGLAENRALGRGQFGHSELASLGRRADRNARFQEAVPNYRPTYAVGFGQGQLGFAAKIPLDKFANVNLVAAQSPSVAAIADRDTGLLEPRLDGVAAHSALLSKCLHGLSGEVRLTEIVDIQVSHVCTPIYEIQTRDSIYVAEGLVKHNCQCTMDEVLDVEPIPADPAVKPDWTHLPKPGDN